MVRRPLAAQPGGAGAACLLQVVGIASSAERKDHPLPLSGAARAEAVLAMVEVPVEIRDDLEARHGEAGREVVRASLDTAHHIVMLAGRSA